MPLDNSMVYCRCCKKAISSSANRCPQCGAEDPFYYKKIRSQGNMLGFARAIIPFLCGLLVVGIVHPKNFTAGMITIIAITVVGYFIADYIFKQSFKKMKQGFEHRIYDIAQEKGDNDPYYNWLKNKPMNLMD